jgi:hypothetical protein
MQFKCCLSSVTKLMYMLEGTVLADIIIWYSTVALACAQLKNNVYKERDVSISTTSSKKLHCYLNSCTVNYLYTITSCMFLSQSCKGQGDRNLQQL